MEIGDKIRINQNAFEISRKYVVPEMQKWLGVEGTITDSMYTHLGDMIYEVDNEFYWEICQITKLETTKLDRSDNMDKLINELTLLYLQKNRDYGNSVQVTYEVFGSTSTLTRISDKINRLKSLRTKEAEVQESIEDTVKDLINYWGIHKSMKSDTKLATFVDTVTGFVRYPNDELELVQEQLSEKILDNDTLGYITHIITELKDINA
ncbi:hypothetical protein G166_gp55 [Clostridium phage phi8074-B1]|uniref:hypothetical protein n=1 Tax=Clostridium phage phi8074-B1 TaxID=1147137 RepID=UPI00025C0C6A|nr:hypothetical protein G166_gp55 [Clostridium phage phi8074-B1]AFC61987.1 hypothetical protein phi8074-B1_00055 [Clostridium phage phi8074-B1]